jgi:cation transport ATPase
VFICERTSGNQRKTIVLLKKPNFQKHKWTRGPRVDHRGEGRKEGPFLGPEGRQQKRTPQPTRHNHTEQREEENNTEHQQRKEGKGKTQKQQKKEKTKKEKKERRKRKRKETKTKGTRATMVSSIAPTLIVLGAQGLQRFHPSLPPSFIGHKGYNGFIHRSHPHSL